MNNIDRSLWRVSCLGDVVQSVVDRVDDPSAAGVDRYVGLDHLDTGSLMIARWGSPSEVQATKLRFRSGDVVFARRRAYQRKLGMAEFDGIASAHSLVLRAKPGQILPDFLPVFLSSDTFMDRAIRISVGSLSPTVNWKTLAVQEFGLPPLEQQRQIADLAWSIERTRVAQLRLVATLEAAVRTWLSTATEADSIPSVRLEDVAEVVGGRQRSPQHADGPRMRRYLRVANIKDDAIDYSDVNEMDFSEKESQKYRLREGDILVSEGQSRELVGQSAIYRQSPGDDLHFQNTLLRVRCGPSVLPEYLQQVFRLYLRRGDFAAVAKQTTSIAHLGVSGLAGMRLPVPTIDVQTRIVELYREYDLGIQQTLSAAASSVALARCLSEEVL